MKKLRLIWILFLIFSCSMIEKVDYKIIKDTNDLVSREKSLIDDIRVRLTNLEKKKIYFELDSNMLINEENITVLKFNLEAFDNKIDMNGKMFDEINITNKNGIIKIDKYSFYGDIYIKAVDSKLILINKLNMEKYLLGVIPYEMPASFPLEALKAQTVIARSYAYKNILRNRKDFDIYDSVSSQVYKGILNKNIENVKKAIEETNGEVIVHDNKIIDAVFHSYSGGYTASGKEVWGNDVPYLQAVEDNYSKDVNSSVLTWEYMINNDIIMDKIGFRIFDFDISYTDSNRVSKLVLYNEDKSKEISYTGNNFRKEFSLSKIKSTSFTLDITDNGINIIGSGYGHGVGFSQWSSRSMAIDYKMSYIDIIKFFYKGVEVIKKGA
ncbi:SpoIID/LytB domain-containing protein [Streptobacillus moniliformis]|uniref:SpoIID/LytB domain protein n=1 Tax=Streptobacillus moniliformis (strain ATCC 14647 / DSM 12112 / NCTC 10651 / 9901) TaxID=519441 RepID=D1AXT2_STRM9|nr:SpoIID/LytB domain-containing protein [Streptobacillus moniliformis]ACZ01108.1 SpoIID/LytB domain protein [Streptobacillus moniliformis DSM 12112]AVL42526.1 SpoIID/LytB domain-containing protein [Streptobacillus moniliformis]SQA13750.1 H-34 [Streptobacillus moniliformis]